MKRSVVSIITGLAAIDLLALAGDSVLERLDPDAYDAMGFTTDTDVLLISLLYTTLFAALGGWIAAKIGRREDLRDTWILAGIQFLMTLTASVMLFDLRMLWYYLASLVLSAAGILAGGRLGTRRSVAAAA